MLFLLHILTKLGKINLKYNKKRENNCFKE